MKYLVMSAALILAAGTTQASGLDDFRQNGQVGYFDLDFTMQGELHDAANYAQRKMEAGTSAAIALGNIPEASAANTQAVGLGLGMYGAGRALALGYSKNDGGMAYKGGLSYTSENDVALGAGVSYSF